MFCPCDVAVAVAVPLPLNAERVMVVSGASGTDGAGGGVMTTVSGVSTCSAVCNRVPGGSVVAVAAQVRKAGTAASGAAGASTPFI